MGKITRVLGLGAQRRGAAVTVALWAGGRVGPSSVAAPRD